MGIQRVTEADFEVEVLRSELPVLVDLYADWCEPCKQLHPILEELASELQGRLKVVQIDVEKSPILAQSFGVRSIPMLVLLANGQPVDHAMGLVDKRRLMEMVTPVLPKSTDTIEPKELAQLIGTGRAVAVDVRDTYAYGRYRIPRAVHVPAEELSTRVQELAPTDGRMRVLYGRTTTEGEEAAKALKAQGVQVPYLVGGFLHWEADGLEVERGK